MSLKRVLGMMLASRMAGRGRRRGGLGTAGMLGGLGRSGLRGKMGIATLGYLAYRAWQDQQSRAAGGASTASKGASTGLGGLVQDIASRLAGSGADDQHGQAQDAQAEERSADQLSDDRALLLIRAMITAAYSDGSLSEAERGRIMSEIDQAGADPEDRQVMEREIANPRPLDELLHQVRDEETAQEFYLASRAAVDGETEADRAYLADLKQRLGLSDQDVEEAEDLAS